jgi:DNA polymerase-1
MVASYLVRESGQHSLDALAAEYLGYKMISYDDLTGTGKDRKELRAIPVEQVSDYSCEDADITFRLTPILRQTLEKQGIISLAHDIEFPLISVLARMEEAGVAVDVGFLNEMSKELERTLDNLTREIHRDAGGEFNINSTQQLSEILFDKLKLAPVRKTKTGFSTDVGVLEALRNEHPIVEKMLEYRQLSKLRSTYVDALPGLINAKTGRVHTSFNQTVAATGRLSSSDPNLQNIPIRTEIGRSIRRAFIPRSAGNFILSADYSQIELRMMAHICDDKGLREAFLNGEDIHATTAAKVFGVDLKDVTKEMRRKAKEVNFGIMYGIGPFGLARRLEISQGEAKEIIGRYFERFPKVREYIDTTIKQAQKDGYVSTLLGRRRYLPELRSRNFNLRSNAERQAINMPIQGSSADMIKVAMVSIDKTLLKEGFSSHMILQVHDELVFDILKEEEGEMRKLVTREMKEALHLSVPIEVEIGVGKNWLEAH